VCIFGRVVSTRQVGENFVHGSLSDMSVDMLVSVIDGDTESGIAGQGL
jgi:hypothetical protein